MTGAARNLKALLARHGLAPRKSLGQHFLVAEGLLERIADQVAEAAGGMPVVEIGPGPGVFTESLLHRDLRVLGVELDAGFEPLHRERFAAELATGALTLHYGDALHLPDERLRAWLGEAPAYVLAGNIPYQITSPLLFDAARRFAAEPPAAAAVFLMQDEVARRAAAMPGSKVYGVLSAKLQLVAEVRLGVAVPAGAFVPPPKVASRLLVATPHPPAERPADDDLRRAGWLIDIAFRQRRKMLAKTLSAGRPEWRAQIEAFLRARELPEKARPEQLAPHDFLDLAAALDPPPPTGR